MSVCHCIKTPQELISTVTPSLDSKVLEGAICKIHHCSVGGITKITL